MAAAISGLLALPPYARRSLGAQAAARVAQPFEVATVAARVEASDWELIALFDGFTFDKGTEESDRIHFVLRAPPAAAP